MFVFIQTQTVTQALNRLHALLVHHARQRLIEQGLLVLIRNNLHLRRHARLKRKPLQQLHPQTMHRADERIGKVICLARHTRLEQSHAHPLLQLRRRLRRKRRGNNTIRANALLEEFHHFRSQPIGFSAACARRYDFEVI